MQNYTIRLRATVDEQGALIKALLTHPMESGFRKNASGESAAAHYITDITLRINDETVLTLLTGSGIAANPLFGWRIADVRSGDTVTVVWRDNLGNTRTKTASAQ
ncbi:MAG TPA: thiosulfate oxidation carrier complex protein SoxZ [Candidatus Accumulibacter phosphatis]|nr:MAG: putative secreted protein [Candidatus Accumulibacter sp. SK-11]HAY29458.1 thiosulfate oxidation carrier complex protein SoxZ [Accumulibacter sp.]HCN66958.1 thiosulfate oxidation carrier complex protein SoxZ [Accumulibacter sp.]HRL77703.1 thiosulfate oxidation carrier complex protein SoxZ [Candidatus Accumulibacter phosphatis]HRQ95638.1 thiosulfate oxidation carrier complex protein SoxZ [Candidatus Accumulibacter phosphatis]